MREPRLPSSLFRTIQDTLKYVPRGLRYGCILRTRCKTVGDKSCQLAGHVVERPRRGPLFARNVAEEA